MMMILKISSIAFFLLLAGCAMVEIDIAVTGTGNPISHNETNDTGIE